MVNSSTPILVNTSVPFDSAGIQITQAKTKAKLWIPLHPALVTALDHWPRANHVILVTSFGKPFTTGFGVWMADKIEKAGLPERCVTDAAITC